MAHLSRVHDSNSPNQLQGVEFGNWSGKSFAFRQVGEKITIWCILVSNAGRRSGIREFGQENILGRDDRWVVLDLDYLLSLIVSSL